MNRYFAWFGLPGSAVLTGLMSALALVLACLNPTPAQGLGLAAMMLSSVGDLFLARFMGLDRRFPNYFVIGAGFFAAAHVLYIAAYGRKLWVLGAPLLNGGTAAAAVLGAGIILLLVGLSLRRGSRDRLGLMVAYGLVISVNCAVALSFAVSQGGSSPTALLAGVGVVSFLLSDAIIGLGIAGNEHRLDRLIWWLYPIGQILLLLGLLGAG